MSLASRKVLATPRPGLAVDREWVSPMIKVGWGSSLLGRGVVVGVLLVSNQTEAGFCLVCVVCSDLSHLPVCALRRTQRRARLSLG